MLQRGLETTAGRSSFILIGKKKQYLVTLALVTPTRNKRSQAQTSIFMIENQHFSIHMAQARPRPGPSPAWARFWKSGNLDIQKFGIQKISENQILKIKVHVTQNVGKVLTSRKKEPPIPMWDHPRPFPWTEQNTKNHIFSLVDRQFSLVELLL